MKDFLFVDDVLMLRAAMFCDFLMLDVLRGDVCVRFCEELVCWYFDKFLKYFDFVCEEDLGEIRDCVNAISRAVRDVFKVSVAVVVVCLC